MKLFKVLFLISSIFAFNQIANAEWKKEVHKTFSGETTTYYVNKASNGAEIVVDMQQDHIAFVHRKTTINYVKGIKLDGTFYKETGKSGGGDDFSDAVFMSKSYSKEVWEKFLDAKKIEVNVEYFRLGDKVSTFNSTKSLRILFPREFPEN